MSEENSLGGILSIDDATDMLLKRGNVKDEDAEQVDTSESEELEADADEVEEEDDTDDSDEAIDDEATDDDAEEEGEDDDTDDDIDADERRKGEMRQADYTRKTQELAAQRQQLEAQRQQFEAHAQQQLDQLEKAVAAFSIPTEAEPNWSELAQSLDAKAYNARRAQWDQKQTQAAQAKLIQEQIAENRYKETRQREEAALLDRIPEWRDNEIREAERDEIFSVAGKFGLTREELAGIMDHRQVEILRTLAIAERAQKAAAKKQGKTRKKVTAAASPVKVNSKEKAQRELSARLAKTGSVEDAAAFLLARSG